MAGTMTAMRELGCWVRRLRIQRAQAAISAYSSGASARVMAGGAGDGAGSVMDLPEERMASSSATCAGVFESKPTSSRLEGSARWPASVAARRVSGSCA
jgi:hypothetical protein